jgi:hypothetical protein
MVIPHIRTTFPASEIFQIDEGNVDELELLFAKDLSINATATEEDPTTPPKTPPTNDLNINTTTKEEEEKQTKPPPTNITIATNEEEELTELSPAESPNSGTTTAEKVRTAPAVEELSINAITTEGDSTTFPIHHCQQGEEAKMWTSVPLLQRISSSNE